MQVPFTIDQFLSSIEKYNVAIWPLQIIFVIIAIAAVLLTVRKTKVTDKFVSSVLFFFWLWMAIMYHILNFSSINKAAYVFGAFYIIQGVLFLITGVFTTKLSFRFKPDFFTIIGLIFLVYALLLYPLIGNMFGHMYPAKPTFGLPCPTTIFTFGILLWTDKRVPKYILVVPLLWSIVGMSAAVSLGIKEDFGLVVAGVLGTVLMFFKDRILKWTKLTCYKM